MSLSALSFLLLAFFFCNSDGADPMASISPGSILVSAPDHCTKNGKSYSDGEQFKLGHLKYRCIKFGIYDIEGCVTGKGKELSLGEHFTADNILYHCLRIDSTVHYRERVCGIFGTKPCDDLTWDHLSAGNVDSTAPASQSRQQQNTMGQTVRQTLMIGNAASSPSSSSSSSSSSSGSGSIPKTLESSGLAGWKLIDPDGRVVPIASLRVTHTYVSLPKSMSMSNAGRRRFARAAHQKAPLDDQAPDVFVPKNGEGRLVFAGWVPAPTDETWRQNAPVDKLLETSRSGFRSSVDWNGRHDPNGMAIGPGQFTFSRRPVSFF